MTINTISLSFLRSDQAHQGLGEQALRVIEKLHLHLFAAVNSQLEVFIILLPEDLKGEAEAQQSPAVCKGHVLGEIFFNLLFAIPGKLVVDWQPLAPDNLLSPEELHFLPVDVNGFSEVEHAAWNLRPKNQNFTRLVHNLYFDLWKFVSTRAIMINNL